jgi:hypothetical protein
MPLQQRHFVSGLNSTLRMPDDFSYRGIPVFLLCAAADIGDSKCHLCAYFRDAAIFC